MILDNITTCLWPQPVIEKTSEFSQQDTEDNFKKNLEKLGSSWNYSSKKILYERNSLGYRTKELDYFKDKDFVLVLGASAAEGIGLPEDEVWHNEIKRQFGFEILNGGLTGSGPDIQMFNSMLFLRQKEMIPKAVVIQWPHISRVMFKGDNLKRLLVPNLNMKIEGTLGDRFWEKFSREQKVVENFYKVWLYDNNDINNSHIFVQVTRMMWKLSKIPYVDFTMNIDDHENINNSIEDLRQKVKSRDLARDMMHDGPQFNLELGKIICNKLKDML